MYKPMDDNGQYNIDCRLSGERTMEENINIMVEFATDIRKEQVGEKKVRNRHEGYGFMADANQDLQIALKAVKDGMKALLESLPLGDGAAVDKTESVANACADTILAATKMAAEAKRISGDLVGDLWGTEKTPLEGLTDEDFEEPETEEKEGEDNGNAD